MSDRVVQMILNEANWLPMSMGLALLAASLLWWKNKGGCTENRQLPAIAMGIFAGVMVGLMAFGHLLAVTIKLLRGELAGPALLLYLIGTVLGVPAVWLVWRALHVLRAKQQEDRALVAPNAWLVAAVLVTGLHNLPLAAPALCGIAYQFHHGRMTRRMIIGLAVFTGMGLFVASLLFMASGRTFEEFSRRN